jgi:PadR family transcriptional regulator, regulatory protein PadR
MYCIVLNLYYICSMNTENQNAQMRRGVLELCILSIIAEKDAYASDIIAKLKEAKLIVVEGTLYPLLTRLKNDGLTVYRWEESKSGPPRKYHQVTELGLILLAGLKADWQSLVSSVESIIGNKQ